MKFQSGDIVFEGDNKDPQATFWTKVTHIPSGICFEDPVGYIRRNDLLRKLLDKLAASNLKRIEK